MISQTAFPWIRDDVRSGGRSSLLLALMLCGLALGCRGESGLPAAGSAEYRQAVSAFYGGLAAMEVGADAHAELELQRVTELAPREPAAWANLGLLALRRNELEVAEERLGRAAELAPGLARIQLLLARLEGQRGRIEEAIAHLHRAVELDTTYVKGFYALARELERRGGEGWAAEALGAQERVLALRPDNLAVLVDMARVASRQGDVDRLQTALGRLEALAEGWPAEAREQLGLVKAATAAGDLEAAASRVAFLRNVLLRLPAYREALAVVWTPEGEIGEPTERFVRMPVPERAVAAAATGLRFTADTLRVTAAERWTWAGVLFTADGAEPAVWVGNAAEVRQVADGAAVPFPGGPSGVSPSFRGVLGVDIDNDFRTDLVLAGAGGLRLWRQDTTGAFTDMTPDAGLPASTIGGAYASVWAADLDLEGDLDLVVGASASGGNARALRNNGDGTFTPLPLFQDLAGPLDFVWTDVDGDADPDAALVDSGGGLRVLLNGRQDGLEEVAVPSGGAPLLSLTAADLDGDGGMDLIALRGDGGIDRFGVSLAGEVSAAETLIPAVEEGWEAGGRGAQLMVADLDNNGALDLIAAGGGVTRIWLQDGDGEYHGLSTAPAGTAFGLAPAEDGAGLDLVGLTHAGQAVVWQSQAEEPYRWVRIRPRAASAAGDQRINSFGIGGVVEVRAGLLFQKQPITGPLVHVGIGLQEQADVARILWPNGVPQAEFELAADTTVRTIQRLKGSCPWIFAYDGSGMGFVTDFIWRSPLGMRINSQDAAGVLLTGDRVKVRGDQLVPRDGVYDVRITAELWETHFFDHVSLIVVDHPVGSEIFVDERFAVPPPDLAVRTTGPVRPIQAARDHHGRDVTALVAARDDRHLGDLGTGRYQGVAGDHYLEIELGPDAPASGPLWLVGSGWVRPTDSSINIALSQGSHPAPRGLSLQVPDGEDGWRTVREDLGFPAGKSKTILIDLEDVLPADGPRRLRLNTNLEIYWDRIGWAVGRPAAPTRERRIDATRAELRYRGFSAVRGGHAEVPEVPIYGNLAGTAQIWLDLIGYYTRFGDVSELLREVDDRYVIMNAGDEIILHFPVVGEPGDGWVRDFVLVGDGWVKDGDYNTLYSKTVTPLPSHAQPEYGFGQPVRLEDDPVYRRHREDWQEYHTRYVAPTRLLRSLVPEPGAP